MTADNACSVEVEKKEVKFPGEEDESNLCREAGDRLRKVATRP